MSADLPRIKKEIDSCIAAFFGCDASMDETEKDHEYILLNMIEKDGKRDLKFIGIGHVTAPGAAGHLEALKSGASDTIGFDKVINIVNHLSTDGENKNTGHCNGLWKLLDDERENVMSISLSSNLFVQYIQTQMPIKICVRVCQKFITWYCNIFPRLGKAHH